MAALRSRRPAGAAVSDWPSRGDGTRPFPRRSPRCSELAPSRGPILGASRNKGGAVMATKTLEAGAAGHGAEPRGRRTDAGEATYLIAIAEALWEEMERDERVFLLGEDIGHYGGAFKVTEGFIDHFGPERVMDTPIVEETIVGMALGAAPP